VADVLVNFRNALDYVLTETLACMDRGMGLDATVNKVKLPEEYGQLPYLQEFYGTVAWSVRAIYTGYLGWFDGNPTNLNPLSPHQRAEKSIELMGGKESVAAAVAGALQSGAAQWALELLDLLLTLYPEDGELRRAKARGLLDLARQETSANGRHYYIACAKELLEDSR
jgi:alkyl sulfatase BDS1-like metallo-beta-lactamase superfamily hydrolase